MDKIKKAIKKFSKSERVIIKEIMSAIERGNISNLDVKKLKGYDNLFRARKGKLRIIFQMLDNENILIAVSRRNDRTYNI